MANLDDHDRMKLVILNRTQWNKRTRKRVAQAYKSYLKSHGIEWTTPRIIPEERLPFIPTETEIDQLIAGCGQRTAALLKTLKETGIRISEAIKLKWTDLDLQSRTLNITPAKGSNPRLLHISDELINMLNRLQDKRQTIFANDKGRLRTHFDEQRKTITKKLQNPRIMRISFHTFRHWKATTEYHKTKDIIHVKNLLGHKNIDSTMVYINLENAIFQTYNDQFVSKAAQTKDEAMQLIEAGFEYIQQIDGYSLYRKRK